MDSEHVGIEKLKIHGRRFLDVYRLAVHLQRVHRLSGKDAWDAAESEFPAWRDAIISLEKRWDQFRRPIDVSGT